MVDNYVGMNSNIFVRSMIKQGKILLHTHLKIIVWKNDEYDFDGKIKDHA
jgi:hypothetical protein